MALGTCIGAKLDTIQKLLDLIESILQRLLMGNELDRELLGKKAHFSD